MKKLGVLLLFLTMGLAGFSLENDPKSAIDSVEYQEWNSDTTWWFINYHYWSAKDTTYDLSIYFSQVEVPAYLTMVVQWGDGTPDSTYSLAHLRKIPKIHHVYGEGRFNMKIIFTDPHLPWGTDLEYDHIVFNQELEGNIKVEPISVRNGGCMEHEQDTFLIRMVDYAANPPHTKYQVGTSLSSDSKSGDYLEVIPINFETSNGDSSYIVFKKPLGKYPLYVSYFSQCTDPLGFRYYLSNQTPQTRIQLYGRPVLKDIFQYDDTITNPIEVCTGLKPSISCDEAFNEMYMDWWGTPLFGDGTLFWMTYYQKDSVTDPDWKVVSTKDKSIVDSAAMIFNKPGFYRIRFIAESECGRDTMYTDSAIDKRLIQVYQTPDTLIYCRDKFLCKGAGEPVTIVDRAMRLVGEKSPEYEVEIRIDDGQDTVILKPEEYSVGTQVWKDGKNIADGDRGCDSTVIRIYGIDVAGMIDITFRRIHRVCGVKVANFRLQMGGEPEFLRDTLRMTLFRHGLEADYDKVYYKCDTFRYTLPDVSAVIHEHGLPVDSIAFYFERGSRRDTILKKEELQTFLFDSTDVFSNLAVSAHNFCGWSKKNESVKVYLRTRPQIEVLRDGISEHDTLCANLEYSYRMGGIVPKSPWVKITFDRDVELNGSLCEANTSKTLGTAFRVKHPAIGLTEEHYIITNGGNSDMGQCRQEFRDTVYVAEAPQGIDFKDSILYCASVTDLNTRLLFQGEDEPRFKQVEWDWNGSVSTDRFPNLVFRSGTVDTLRVNVMQHAGCSLRDTLLFIPKTTPEITNFAGRDTVCVADVVSYAVFDPALIRGNFGSQQIKADVYQNVYPALYLGSYGSLQTIPLTADMEDSLWLIYHVYHPEVDTVFGNCSLMDTLTVNLIKPRLAITKKDTMGLPLDAYYDFKRIENYVDTFYLKKNTVEWSKAAYLSGSLSTHPDLIYTLAESDKGRDSLVFYLKGETYCNIEMADSLIVYLPRPQLNGFTDTICDNIEYALWENAKMTSNFIDMATLQWRIVNAGEGPWGSLITATGAQAKYKPVPGIPQDKPVEIEVSGGFAGGDLLTAKIYLRVNPAVETTLLRDTLIAKERRVDVEQISASFLTVRNYQTLSFKKISGDGEVLSGKEYRFGGDLNVNQNYEGVVRIVYEALKGCADGETENIRVFDLVNVNIEGQVAEICPQEDVPLEDVFTFQGKDKYTVLEWEKLGTDKGHFDAGFTHYVLAGTEGLQLKVTGYKQCIFYDGSSAPLHYRENSAVARDFVRYRPLPKINLTDLETCGEAGSSVTIPVQYDELRTSITQVDWLAKGKEIAFAQTGQGDTQVVYPVSASDVEQGYIELIGKVTSDICSVATTEDTVKVSFWARPAIQLLKAAPSVCQGDSLALSEVVDIRQSTGFKWEILEGGGKLEETSRDTFYLPPASAGVSAKLRITAYAEHGCRDSVLDIEVAIGSAPLPDFTASSPLCQGDEVLFTAVGNEGIHYEWDFGEDSQKQTGTVVKHQFKESGNQEVRLTVTYASCTRSYQKEMILNPKPQAVIDMKTQIPGNVLVDFREASVSEEALNSYEWSFDGTVACQGNHAAVCQKLFPNIGGTAEVALVVTTVNGCTDTARMTVEIVDRPVADFTVSYDPCDDLGRVTFHVENVQVNGSDLRWDFGNGNQLEGVEQPAPVDYGRYYQDTVFTVSLTLVNAADSVVHREEVRFTSKLKAGMDMLGDIGDGCNRSDRYIRNLTRGQAQWTEVYWGDGSSDRWEDPVRVSQLKHHYENNTTQLQTYDVVLVTSNACLNEPDTARSTVQVQPLNQDVKILLDDTYKDLCYGHDRGFVNKSFGFIKSGYRCVWSFEGGEKVTDNRDTVVYRFERPGTYVVSLEVSDVCGSIKDEITVQVLGNDSLDFTEGNAILCAGEDLELIHVPHGSSTFTDLTWILPDGGSRTGSRMVWSEVSAGALLVRLEAKADNCPVSKEKTIQVYKRPQAVASLTAKEGGSKITEGCAPLSVQFYGQDMQQLNNTVFWDFGGTTAGEASGSYTFAQEGEYSVLFKLTSPEGCQDSVIYPLTVKHSPEVRFRFLDSLFCTKDGNFEVHVENVSPDINTTHFEWWSGNNQVALGASPSAIRFHNQFGNVELKLKGTDMVNRCTAEWTKTFMASYLIKADFETDPLNVCEGSPVIFKNTSESMFENYASDPYKSSWYFENTYLATDEEEIEYTFSDYGHYTIKLVAANADGCQDSIEKDVKVFPMPVADFNWSKDNSVTGFADSLNLPDVENGGVRFENYSHIVSFEGKDALSYRWNFGDTTYTTGKSPAHQYANNGNYTVWLVVRSEYGCVDSVSDIVTVAAVKGLFVPNAMVPASVDDGLRYFEPKGIGLARYKLEVFDEWGGCIWSTEAIENGMPAERWDGTFKGEPLPKGLYLWKASAIFVDGTVWEGNKGQTQGYVNLIR